MRDRVKVRVKNTANKFAVLDREKWLSKLKKFKTDKSTNSKRISDFWLIKNELNSKNVKLQNYI